MKRLRRSLTALATTAAAIVLSFAVANPALAADFTMQTQDGDPGGKIYWTAYGDVVKVCDQEADGWAVYASIGYYIGTSWGDEVYDLQVGGNGNCITRRASDGALYDLSETKPIFLKVCLDKSTENHSYCDTHVWYQ